MTEGPKHLTQAERNARHRAKDPERRRAAVREAQRRWYLNNPMVARAALGASHANQRAKRLGVPGRIARADVLPLLSKPCHYCGRFDGPTRRERIGVDHVVPLVDGGANAPENLVPSCVACNLSKRHGTSPRKGPHWQRSEGLIADADFQRVKRETYG